MRRYLSLIPEALAVVILLLVVIFRPVGIIGGYADFAQTDFWFAFSLFIFSAVSVALLLSGDTFVAAPFDRKAVMYALSLHLVNLSFSIHEEWQTFAILAIVALWYGIRNRRFKVENLFWLFFAYFLLHVISLCWAPDVLAGIDRLRTYSIFLVVPLVFSCIDLKRDELDLIVVLFARFMLVFALLSLASMILTGSLYDVAPLEWLKVRKVSYDGIFSYNLVYGWSIYHHPTYNATALLLALFAALWRCGRRPSGNCISYFELSALYVLVLILVLATQSRFGLVGWVFAAWALPLHFLHKRRNLLRGYVLCSFVMSVILSVIGWPLLEVFINDPARQQNFDTAFYYISQNPWIGTGVEGIRQVMDDHEIAISLGWPWANEGLANPHHQWIGDWMQTGIAGLIVLTFLVLSIVYESVRKENWVLLGSMAVFVLLMQVEMPFYLPKGCFYFCSYALLLLMYNDAE